jgi:hypothetical protein
MNNLFSVVKSATGTIALAKYPKVMVKNEGGRALRIGALSVSEHERAVQTRVLGLRGAALHWETDVTQRTNEGGYKHASRISPRS